LTGDLLAFVKCGLQYRYYNKGNLSPSVPAQMWFGEFIHAVLEEAYRRWKEGHDPNSEYSNYVRFPWDWRTLIRKIEMEIDKRLRARGIYSPPNLFCHFEKPDPNRIGLCPDANHPHKLIASWRVDLAINTWGKHLFPLISEAEVKLRGLRDLPKSNIGAPRSDYYEITGVVDVLGSVNILNPENSGNLILKYLEDSKVLENSPDTFEIIVEYKGMRRPASTSPEWKWHEGQVLTYAHLRERQQGAKPVIAAIILYINELYPSKEDIGKLYWEVKKGETDLKPQNQMDIDFLDNWPKIKQNLTTDEAANSLTLPYREKRSIRVIPIHHDKIQESLMEFDEAVKEIEELIMQESQTGKIIPVWSGRAKPSHETCIACDFKTICPVLKKAVNEKQIKNTTTTPTIP